MSRIYKVLMMTFSLAVLMFACNEDEKEEPSGAELTVHEAERRVSFSNAAGNVQVAVTASGEYTATVGTGTDWCTVSDVGNQGFRISVSENTARAERTAVITVASPGCASIEIAVTQLGLEPALIIDNWDKTVMFPRGGGDTLIAVTANGTYTATVVTGTEWCTVSVVSQGLQISVAANAGTEERSAKITVAMTGATNVEITVMQGASASLAVADADRNPVLKAAGETRMFVPLVTNGEFDVTLVGGDGWCTVSDTSKNDFSVTVSRNIELESRSAKIILTVKQQSETPPVEINVTQAGSLLKIDSKAEFNSGVAFADEQTVPVISKATGLVYAADAVDSWIVPEVVGDKVKIKVDVPPFEGTERTGKVIVSTGGDSAELYVTQLACLDKSLMGAHYVGDDNRTIFDPGSQQMDKLFDGISNKYPSTATSMFCTAANTDGTNNVPPAEGSTAWTFPFCITMDLGGDFYLNSFKITPRNNRANRKWEFGLGSPYNFEIWGTNVDRADIPADDPYWQDAWKSDWQYLGNFTTYNSGGYTPEEVRAQGIGILTDADCYMAAEGYPFALPATATPVRYLRFQINQVWGVDTYVHFNELWFWGEK